MRSKFNVTCDANLYRILQAASTLKLFKIERGREAETIDELEDWAQHLKSQVEPEKILTPAELRATVHSVIGA